MLYFTLQSQDEQYIEMLIASEEEERKHSRQVILRVQYFTLQSQDEEYIEMLIASEEKERKHSRQVILECCILHYRVRMKST